MCLLIKEFNDGRIQFFPRFLVFGDPEDRDKLLSFFCPDPQHNCTGSSLKKVVNKPCSACCLGPHSQMGKSKECLSFLKKGRQIEKVGLVALAEEELAWESNVFSFGTLPKGEHF